MSRVLLALAGVLVAAYGGYLLLTRQRGEDHVATATWLVAGVVLHDFVLAPLVLLVVAVAGPALPQPARAPAVAGLVVLGAVTLVGVPVLGRFGAHADNPTLLDRPYVAGWAVLAALVVAVVVVASVLRRRRGATRRPPA